MPEKKIVEENDIERRRTAEEGSPSDGGVLSLPYLLPDGNVDWEVALKVNECWMRPLIAKRTGEESAVDEVFQNIALATAAQKSPIRDVTKVNSWLYRLVIIQSALFRRTAGRKRKLLQRVEEKYGTTTEEQALQLDPLEWLLKEERKQLVKDALTTLSEEDQKILRMRYAEDKSYQQIADDLNASLSTVQSKLHRARIKLKKILQKYD